jgi:MscS family membrane protein
MLRVFLSQKRSALRTTCACLLLFCFLLCLPARAEQIKAAPTASAPPPAQAEIAKDPLGRNTPRGAVLGFLDVARKGQDEIAAQYLNTRLRGKAAEDLAHQLFVVLDRRLPARLNQLSDRPEGSSLNPLSPDEELVGNIQSENQNVKIIVQRVDRGKAGLLWLFSSNTLDAIPGLYDQVNEVSVDSFLPDFLITTRIASVALFEWIAFLVGMPLLYFLTVILSGLLNRLNGLVHRRLSTKSDTPKYDILPNPVRLLLLGFFIEWATSKVSLPLLARQFWSSTATLIFIAATVWLLISCAAWGEGRIRGVLKSRDLRASLAILHLGRCVVDFLIICAGVFVTLHYFGVNPEAALAGLGVGGIAIAFAAQKTLENVIGGVSIIFDQAVRVGDNLKVGESLGVVENIGLRSTRIRTPDRTVVIVPNGQIANMSLESFSSRDKFWFHPIPALSYRTSSAQLTTVLERIRAVMQENPNLETSTARVRFLRLGTASLDIEIFAYVLARDWNQFLKIQEFLLLRIIDCIESSGVQFAFPLQGGAAAAFNSSDDSEQRSVNVLRPEKNPNEREPAVKSA